jgi:hypothetical protein
MICSSVNRFRFICPSFNRGRTLTPSGGKTQWQVNPAQGTSDFDYFHIDLVNGGRAEMAGACVPVARWNIWTNEAERNRPGATPLVSFG